jgi:hypothetical protein
MFGVGREKRGPFSLRENGISIFAPPMVSGILLELGPAGDEDGFEARCDGA